MTKTVKILAGLGAVAMLAWGGVALAQGGAVRAAIAAGQVGERADGYLGIRGSVGGDVRAELEASGLPIGPLDTQIAAHALSLDVTLVSNNQREFQRVRGLRCVNWA